MATLYIAEFQPDQRGNFQVASVPPIAEQTVAIGAGAAASNAFNKVTGLVRITTDAICSIAFGASPTATATNMRLAADQVEYFAVPQGASIKVSVITNS